MGHLDDAFYYADQLTSRWELIILDNEYSQNNFKTRVQDVSIPMYKLNAERKITGHTMYKTLEDLGEITLTMRETPSFLIYNYFKDWFNVVYDLENRCFRVITNTSDAFREVRLVFKQGLIANEIGSAYTNYAKSTANIFKDLSIESFDKSTNNKEEKDGTYFTLHNCKIIGLDALSVDYASGTPLTFSVTILPEAMDNN